MEINKNRDINNKVLLLSVCFFLSVLACRAQHIGDYVLNISKINQDEANMHVSCSFVIDFQKSDSIVMNFGGDGKLSVENLTIQTDTSSLKYCYQPDARKLVFKKIQGRNIGVKMNYNYTNLSAFFIYGGGTAELWETSFNEHYYPYLPDCYADITLNLELPDSIFPLCSYPLKHTGSGKYGCRINGMLQQSLSLALLQKDAYIRTTAGEPYDMDIYQIAGMQCSKRRYDELLELARTSISYFGKIYGDEYLCLQRGITQYPAFVFHNGKGFSNRYNIGFISASQEKFSTYPDIYPLVHEIGHRWLGEWTLLIRDGQPGAYFIKESLNEFMTLMFLRQHFGNGLYLSLIEKYNAEYQKIINTPQDEPVVNLVENNNNTVVYRKGPLILDRFAKEIGYENCISLISSFYQKYAGKPNLKYSDFINLVNSTWPNAANELKNWIEN